MNKYKRIRPVAYADESMVCTHCSHTFQGVMKFYPYTRNVLVYCPKCKQKFPYEMPEEKFGAYIRSLDPEMAEMVVQARKEGFSRELTFRNKDISNYSPEDIHKLIKYSKKNGKVAMLLFFISIFGIMTIPVFLISSFILVMGICMGGMMCGMAGLVWYSLNIGTAGKKIRQIQIYEKLYDESILPDGMVEPLDQGTVERIEEDKNNESVNVRLNQELKGREHDEHFAAFGFDGTDKEHGIADEHMGKQGGVGGGRGSDHSISM